MPLVSFINCAWKLLQLAPELDVVLVLLATKARALVAFNGNLHTDLDSG